MAQKINRLTALKISKLSAAGLYADGNNLYLRVSPGWSKAWALIYNYNGVRRELGLGRANVITLAAARERASECARLRQQGLDPKAVWAAADTERMDLSFGAIALEVIADKRAGWRNAKHAQQWENTLRSYADAIWSKPVSDVDIDDVLAILRPIWSTKEETASRVRGRIQAVLDAAKARKLRSGDNPAAWSGNLALLLHAHRSGPRRHQPAMPYEDVPLFMKVLRARGDVSARALELTILTAARTTEVREANWNEFSLSESLWCVSADRMKMGREHRVALSSGALSVLSRLDGQSGLLFPGKRPGSAISNMTMLQLLKRMDLGRYTVHGFRSSFSTWAAEQTSFPREVVEEALAHVVGTAVERTYRRSDLLTKRIALMQAWSDFVLST